MADGSVGEQRGGPSHSGDGHCRRGQRPSCGNEQGDRGDEPEDRDEDEVVHRRMECRVERQEDVVVLARSRARPCPRPARRRARRGTGRAPMTCAPSAIQAMAADREREGDQPHGAGLERAQGPRPAGRRSQAPAAVRGSSRRIQDNATASPGNATAASVLPRALSVLPTGTRLSAAGARAPRRDRRPREARRPGYPPTRGAALPSRPSSAGRRSSVRPPRRRDHPAASGGSRAGV